ncbi:MAG: PilZ domain-containing protein [Terriglobales bacterium]
MDSHVINDKPGFLQSEKRRREDRTEERAAQSSEASACAALPPFPQEKRRSPRFQCCGSVEFQAEGSDQQILGNLTDISLHGCYAETTCAFPVQTAATVEIKALGVHVRLHATVRASYPGLGMGLCFSEVDPSEKQKLEQLLHALIEQRATLNHSPEVKAGVLKVLASEEAWSCLKAISSYFERNATLSRDEFRAITKKIRHA